MNRTLSLWIPSESSRPLYVALMKTYCERHQDVKVVITDIPLCNYWQTLTEALQQGKGPDLFFMHNEHAKELIEHHWMAPYVFTTQQQEVLNAYYPESSDQIYYYDFAYLTSLLYAQKDLNITDTSWEACFKQLKKQKLARYDFGCTINLDAAAAFYTMVSLQQSEYEAQEKVNTEQWLHHMLQEIRVYDVHQDCKEAFLSKDIAMVYSWGWFAGYLNDAQMEYQVIPMCHEPDTIIDRRNTKSSCGINAASKNQALANDVIFEFLSDETMQKQFCLTRKVVPLHKELQHDGDIQHDRVLMAQKAILSNTMFPKAPQSEADIDKAMKRIQMIYETK